MIDDVKGTKCPKLVGMYLCITEAFSDTRAFVVHLLLRTKREREGKKGKMLGGSERERWSEGMKEL